MRTFSNQVQSVLDSNSIDFFFLIDLFLTTTYRFVSLPYNVDFNNNTYNGNSALFEYDNPRFSSVVDREAYKIVLTDFLNDISNEMQSNIVGKDVEVRVGFLNADKQPILTPSDVLFVYKGFIDRPSLQSTEENKIAVIEGTSPMADLDMVNSFMSSKDGMAQRSGADSNGNPTDTSFNFIYDNEEIMMKWGKI